MNDEIEQLRFLSEDQVRALTAEHGAPLYVYSRSQLNQRADEFLSAFADAPFGLKVRFAMKANPHTEIMQRFARKGLGIDASSDYEAWDAIDAGIDASDILLTSQQLPDDIARTVDAGVEFTATSRHQIDEYGKAFAGGEISLRINPRIGTGLVKRLTTGGAAAAFGIWFDEDSAQGIKNAVNEHDLKVKRIHAHVGSGGDPAIWGQVMASVLAALRHFPEAKIINLGGGFKVAYMNGERATNLDEMGQIANRLLTEFHKETGRELLLELEPGRYLTAPGASLIAKIIDKTTTDNGGRSFLRINTGMNDFLRTGMYGSNHPLVVVPASPADTDRIIDECIVAGHCCESSDIFTTVGGDAEVVEPRPMHSAEIGDLMVIEMAGAYCASMSARGYNSFPVAKEILVD